MSSYNVIKFKRICPKCKIETNMNAQLHSVSSYDGDTSGSFCLREYYEGEKLSWWKVHKPDPEDDLNPFLESITESCYGKCTVCNSDIVAMIHVEGFKTKIVKIGLESEWSKELA